MSLAENRSDPLHHCNPGQPQDETIHPGCSMMGDEQRAECHQQGTGELMWISLLAHCCRTRVAT